MRLRPFFEIFLIKSDVTSLIKKHYQIRYQQVQIGQKLQQNIEKAH